MSADTTIPARMPKVKPMASMPEPAKLKAPRSYTRTDASWSTSVAATNVRKPLQRPATLPHPPAVRHFDHDHPARHACHHGDERVDRGRVRLDDCASRAGEDPPR